MPAESLSKEEVRLLGQLLRGENVRGPMRAAVRLVSRRYTEWEEPSGDLLLTPQGRLAAQQLWPDVVEAPVAAEASFDGSAVARQIALPLVETSAPRSELADALVAVLGHSTQGELLAKVVLDHYPRGRGLASASRRALQALGLPPAEARALHDAFALARACHREEDHLGRPVRDTDDLARAIYTATDVLEREVECFWVASLDGQRRLVDVSCVAQGSLAKVEISMRDLFVPLVRARAAACVVAHNHPSGDLRWSDSDVKLTQRVMACAERLGIEFVDHLILTPSGQYASLETEADL
jgi:DNA repair protein RadC